ncbi:NAD(+) diphosphatase [Oceaniglobus ichthyenteri]|uniref:NAD(+) diphosphatase n=1 Tax=Oceaniglobus ichthyenteri TaxID=2136177 RepID=UPI000D3BF497|nr:NAD(+) diphosphatase [Oceaniglobus ichthyenteri]
MKLAETVTFGGGGLQRAGELRGDAAAQARMWADPDARVIPIWRGKPLFSFGGGAMAPGWLRVGDPVLRAAGPPVFLGLADGPRFAVDLSAWVPEALPDTLHDFFDPSEQAHPDLPDALRFAELRGVMTALSPLDVEIVASGKAVLAWHSIHRFCARCGAESHMAMAGWQRNCAACGGHHFPRTDPVVIMLITHGNSVLLGRSPGWPDGMYSLLAGFVEPGETIEAAVRREVMEESGIKVGRVGYLSSQPWPFPASLMFGCWGEATSTDITIDPNEIEEALWLPREDMMQVFAGDHPRIRPPRRGAIAGFLLHHWVADTLD